MHIKQLSVETSCWNTVRYVWFVTINSIASILDLWKGHKICRLYPVALEKNLFFKKDCSPPTEDRLQGKYDCILFWCCPLKVQNIIVFLKLLWKHWVQTPIFRLLNGWSFLTISWRFKDSHQRPKAGTKLVCKSRSRQFYRKHFGAKRTRL